MPEQEFLRFGQYVLDVSGERLFHVAGNPEEWTDVPLRRQVFRALAYLVQRAGEDILVTDLWEAIPKKPRVRRWGKRAQDEQDYDPQLRGAQLLVELRKALRDHAGEPQYFKPMGTGTVCFFCPVERTPPVRPNTAVRATGDALLSSAKPDLPNLSPNGVSQSRDGFVASTDPANRISSLFLHVARIIAGLGHLLYSPASFLVAIDEQPLRSSINRALVTIVVCGLVWGESSGISANNLLVWKAAILGGTEFLVVVLLSTILFYLSWRAVRGRLSFGKAFAIQANVCGATVLFVTVVFLASDRILATFATGLPRFTASVLTVRELASGIGTVLECADDLSFGACAKQSAFFQPAGLTVLALLLSIE